MVTARSAARGLRGDHEHPGWPGLTAPARRVLLRPAAVAAGTEQHQVRQAGGMAQRALESHLAAERMAEHWPASTNPGRPSDVRWRLSAPGWPGAAELGGKLAGRLDRAEAAELESGF